MKITIANISTKVDAADFQKAVAAIGQQATHDFTPEWGISAVLRATALSIKNKVKIQGHHDAIIYLGDSSQDPTTGVEGALGYHSETYGKVPYGFVYLDICAEYGENWTTTLSHEVLETLGDPDAAMTVTGPAPHGKGTAYYDLEVADPTQGDSYVVDGVDVSNFVGRAYFGLTGGSGKTNFLDLTLAAFGVRPGGYFQYEQNGKVHQVQGESVTERQRAAKERMKAYRRNGRREIRLEGRAQHVTA